MLPRRCDSQIERHVVALTNGVEQAAIEVILDLTILVPLGFAIAEFDFECCGRNVMTASFATPAARATEKMMWSSAPHEGVRVSTV